MCTQEAAESLSSLQLKTCRDAFMLFDQDGDGQITGKEVQDLLGSLGYTIPQSSVGEMVREIDTDGETLPGIRSVYTPYHTRTYIFESGMGDLLVAHLTV